MAWLALKGHCYWQPLKGLLSRISFFLIMAVSWPIPYINFTLNARTTCFPKRDYLGLCRTCPLLIHSLLGLWCISLSLPHPNPLRWHSVPTRTSVYVLYTPSLLATLPPCTHSTSAVLLLSLAEVFQRWFYVFSSVPIQCDTCITIPYVLNSFSLSTPFLRIGHRNNLMVILRKESLFFKYFSIAFAILPTVAGGLA